MCMTVCWWPHHDTLLSSSETADQNNLQWLLFSCSILRPRTKLRGLDSQHPQWKCPVRVYHARGPMGKHRTPWLLAWSLSDGAPSGLAEQLSWSAHHFSPFGGHLTKLPPSLGTKLHHQGCSYTLISLIRLFFRAGSTGASPECAAFH